MRYAIFTDIHANLEALEAVLAKIDELAQQEPVDQIWFLGDLVGYGPNPNECITRLRERTDVIIAGNHDWAAVGKIDLEDFSEAARISAEWTAKQLTEEHRQFLTELPERLEIGECTLVHGSPYGPLWEYLTSEVLAERSFQYFNTRYCIVVHTHVPIIFQQPDVANTPTLPLGENETTSSQEEGADEDETEHIPAIHAVAAAARSSAATGDLEAHAETETVNDSIDVRERAAEIQHQVDDEQQPEAVTPVEQGEIASTTGMVDTSDEDEQHNDEEAEKDSTTPEEAIQNAEERLNEEIEELLALLGLSQSMITITNEMVVPPEGQWEAPEGYRAIINPGGVGQPRDGDSRASFMIYDTEHGFTFYRIPYPLEKTQEKIIKAGLPKYLATRLAYGR